MKPESLVKLALNLLAAFSQKDSKVEFAWVGKLYDLDPCGYYHDRQRAPWRCKRFWEKVGNLLAPYGVKLVNNGHDPTDLYAVRNPTTGGNKMLSNLPPDKTDATISGNRLVDIEYEKLMDWLEAKIAESDLQLEEKEIFFEAGMAAVRLYRQGQKDGYDTAKKLAESS